MALQMEAANRRIEAIMKPFQESADRMFCTIALALYVVWVLQDFIDWLSSREQVVPADPTHKPL